MGDVTFLGGTITGVYVRYGSMLLVLRGGWTVGGSKIFMGKRVLNRNT